MSLLDTSNLSEESQNAIVPIEQKKNSLFTNKERKNYSLPVPTAADRVALMEEMRKDPNISKKTRPNNLAKTLELLKKLG